jgi:hypothetical protein
MPLVEKLWTYIHAEKHSNIGTSLPREFLGILTQYELKLHRNGDNYMNDTPLLAATYTSKYPTFCLGLLFHMETDYEQNVA